MMFASNARCTAGLLPAKYRDAIKCDPNVANRRCKRGAVGRVDRLQSARACRFQKRCGCQDWHTAPKVQDEQIVIAAHQHVGITCKNERQKLMVFGVTARRMHLRFIRR